MTRKHTVLLADDEETLRLNLAQVLEEEGFDVLACPDGTSALKALKTRSVDALITDLRMPGIRGLDLIGHARELCPEASIIVITSFGEVETAVEAMKSGARDYLCKPLIFDELIFKLKRLLAHDGLERENQLLRAQIRQAHDTSGVVAESPAMRSIIETVQRVSHTMSNVLINGESGTGKEVLARLLHYAGITHDKPFVVVNCGGLVDTLVESELFGYRRGAFTGANTDRAGYFEAADGGTLFLDEIGNLPLASQAVLLRAIEQKSVVRVGDNRPRPVHIRIVAATNRDLDAALQTGDFREDLYFRLNVVRVTIPPLRDRPQDIPPLVDHFVAMYNEQLNARCPGFTDEAMQTLCTHAWRGNVRELENIVERALIFSGSAPITVDELAVALGQTPTPQVSAVPLREALREFERQHITKVLEKHSHNKAEAAEALGIGLSSLYRKLEELAIGKNETGAGH